MEKIKGHPMKRGVALSNLKFLITRENQGRPKESGMALARWHPMKSGASFEFILDGKSCLNCLGDVA